MITFRDDVGLFEVTDFDSASTILRGGGWSSDPAMSPLVPPAATQLPTSLMLFRDPPDHTRLRRNVAPAFSARAIAALQPRVAAIVEACLEGLGEDSGRVDLLADYAYLVPIAVIAELLDVGLEGAQVFLDQTPHLVKLLELDASGEDFAEATAAGLEATMFLTPVLAERKAAVDRGEPGADFISQLLTTELTLDEVLATCVLLLAAGHETTSNLIANGALAIMEHPDQVEHLEKDPARAVEELLRLHGPVTTMARTALEDHRINGTTIRRGQVTLIRLDQVGRDPARWSDPDTLDLSRESKGHLAFGTGIHFCLGAALARLEGTEALTRLFRAHPQIRPAGAAHRRTSSTFHALESLPVTL
jgi:cytochrome P450